MSTLATGLSAEDEAEIKSILQTWKDAGTDNPLLPMNVDIDGDGLVDSFGLDEEGNIIVVLGKLKDTVYESEGDDRVAS